MKITVKATETRRATRTDNGPGLTGIPSVVVTDEAALEARTDWYRAPRYRIENRMGTRPAVVEFTPDGEWTETGNRPGKAFPDATPEAPAGCGGGFAAPVITATRRGVATITIGDVIENDAAYIGFRSERISADDLIACYRLGVNPLLVLRERLRGTWEFHKDWASLAAVESSSGKLGWYFDTGYGWVSYLP